MPKAERIRLLVLVKANPIMTADLDETMCVAGLRLDTDAPEWVRIHPVPFRDLQDNERFAKYQEIEVDVIRSRTDRRPETWVPIEHSITVGASYGTQDGWAARRHLVDQLPEVSMCELVAENQAGHGPNSRSLGVVRPVEPPRLVITERDQEQVDTWRTRAKAASGRTSLFADSTTPKPDLEIVPWRFRYHYKCADEGCSGHKQTVVDWEAAMLWLHVRDRADWREAMEQKFSHDLWDGKDAVLFVGNQEQHPTSFLVLGVFYPPGGAQQLAML
jgi:hypothetical protein